MILDHESPDETTDRLVTELEKLKAFYNAVARLTSNHDVIENCYASVSPAELGKELEKIDPEWWKIC